MPLIKVESIGKVQKGRARLTEVHGEKLDGSGPWKGSFYSSDSDLSNQLNEFGKGDVCNVKMAQNSKGYWDVKCFEEASDDLIAKVQGAGSGKPNSYGSGSTGSSGKSGSTWNGRTGDAYDRSSAIYLALDFLKSVLTDAKLKKLTEAELIDSAEIFNAYIHDGKTEEPINNSDDALEPPDVD